MLTIEQRKQLIESTKGRFFSALVTKVNGEERWITGRLDVARYTKGGTNPNPKIGVSQLIVWEPKGPQGQYRTLNLEKMKEFHFRSKKVKV